MRSLNDEFDEYRDCLRIVWNYAMRRRSTGVAGFDDLASAMLKALVLDGLADPSPQNVVRNDRGGIPGLGVIVAVDAPEVLAPDERDAEVIWNRVNPGICRGTVLNVVDVFDFHDLDGMRELDYIRAIAQGAFGDVAAGATVALRRSDVDVVDLTA